MISNNDHIEIFKLNWVCMTKRYQKALLSISYIDRKQQKKKNNYLSLQGCSNMILDFFFYRG